MSHMLTRRSIAARRRRSRDAWGGAGAARNWPPLVPLAAMGACTASGLATRAGCGCWEHTRRRAEPARRRRWRFTASSRAPPSHSPPRQRSRWHWPCTGSPKAWPRGALLGGRLRRVAGWPAAMSVSPIFGAVTASAFPVPEATEPVLLGLAAGVIAQAAWVGLRAAFHGLCTGRLELPHTVAVAVAAIITALAVNAAG